MTEDLNFDRKAEGGKDRQQILESVYNNIEQGVCLHKIIYENDIAVDYLIIDANPAYEKILGIPLQKAKGSLGSEIYKTNNPPYLDKYSKVAEAGTSIEFEDYFSPMDKYFNITVTSPGPGKFITLFSDITEDKLKEQKIRENEIKYMRLFNRAPVGIFKSNSQGQLLSINKFMAEIMGYPNIEEALKMHQDLSIDLYENPERREKFLNALTDKDKVKNFELKAVLNNEKHIWLSLNARINEMHDDGSFIIEGFAFDITERKNYEKQLEDQKQKLQGSYEELSAANEELEDSMEEINKLNERFINMINLVSHLYGRAEKNDKNFMSDLLKTAIKIVPEADYGKIFIFEKDDSCRFVDAVGHDIELLKDIKINKEVLFHFSDEGTYLSDEYSLDLERAPDCQKWLLEKALKPIKKSIFINIKISSEIVGRIILDIKEGSDKKFSSTTRLLLKSFANLGSAFYSFQRYNELQGQFTRELILSVIKILEMYDKYTSGHSHNVAELGAEIAGEMGLSESKIKDVYWAGMVHDLGKLLVPLDILNKKGSLTVKEYDIIKQHSYWSYKVLRDSSSLRHIAKYVLHHHERWDSYGYPHRLQGDEIPLISQILAVADAWDAMTSNRSYRAPLSKEEALQEIIDNRGAQFSPEVVEAFLKNEIFENQAS